MNEMYSYSSVFCLSVSFMKLKTFIIYLQLLISCLILINVDIKGNNLILSAKSSLIKHAQQIPSDINQIQPNSVVNVSDDAY